MEKLVKPPKPDEISLTTMVTKDVAFPNGRTVRYKMSQWHWDMISFADIWNEYYGRENGMLYEFYKKIPNSTDEQLSHATMTSLRDQYNSILADTIEGEEPEFFDPR
jgi:hypothetical protein